MACSHYRPRQEPQGWRYMLSNQYLCPQRKPLNEIVHQQNSKGGINSDSVYDQDLDAGRRNQRPVLGVLRRDRPERW